MITLYKPWMVIKVDSFGEITTSCYMTYESAAKQVNWDIKYCDKKDAKCEVSFIDLNENERDAYIQYPDKDDPDWVVWRIVNIYEEQNTRVNKKRIQQ